jgi:hypothetical protein
MEPRRRKGREGGLMKNKLIDLNNHLFAQMERLSNEETKGDALNEEIKRAKAVGGIAKQIIGNASLALNAQVKIRENLIKKPPLMLGIAGEDVEE